jgi:hypothetical protein
MSRPSTSRLRALIATGAAGALAATLLVTAPAAASPTACRVKNLDTGVTRSSLQQAHNAAKKGHRLTVRGTCVGVTTLRKSLTITGITTATSGKPILDAKLNGTVVTVRPAATVTLKGLTIRGGATPGDGGGVYNRGTLVLRDVVVRGNTAESGGGIYNAGGTLTLNGSSSIRGNTADWGGGIYNEGVTLTLNGSSSIRGNHAEVGGGGIRNLGTLTLNGSSSIRGNTALGGGGIDNRGTLTLNDSSSIRANTAGYAGGVGNQATMTMRHRSTVRDNSTTNYAGGVLNAGSLKMRGSSAISGNATDPASNGGGLWNSPEGHDLDGVRCPMPGAKVNVRDNTPDDCWPDPLMP